MADSITPNKSTFHFRLLWANPFCLLDTSSGAAMAVRQMLHQLARQGVTVEIIGATVFDSGKGSSLLDLDEHATGNAESDVIVVDDSPLQHQLVKTAQVFRNQVTAQEEARWMRFYRYVLEQRPPDVVFYYGGKPMDWLIADEARACGIPAVFYLANGHYYGHRWYRDLSLILTDSLATARLYRQRLGVSPVPVGAFVDPKKVVAENHQPERVLLVNPALEKGGALMIQLALLLEKRRPDIVFEVVESRGNWLGLLEQVTESLGTRRSSLDNVVVTPNTHDMRPIYAKTRLLLAPSLGWESLGRVTVEAMLNGIPALVTDRGGLPEAVGEGGVVIKLPEACYQPPFTRLPTNALLFPVVKTIERLFDDAAHYQQMAFQAKKQAGRHGLSVSTRRLMAALRPVVNERR